MTPTDIPREKESPRWDREPNLSTTRAPSRVDMPERVLYAIASLIGRTSQQEFEAQKHQDQSAQRLAVVARPAPQELPQHHAQPSHHPAEETHQPQSQGSVRGQHAEGKSR